MQKLLQSTALAVILTGVLCFGVGSGNLFPEPHVSTFAQFLSRTFHAVFLVVGLSFCLFGRLRAGENRLLRLGLVLVVVLLAVGFEQLGEKLRWEPRPGPSWPNIPGRSSGFPSGHATAAFALAVLAGALFPRWIWLGLGCAVLIGYSRAEVLAHYPHQVVAGAFCGTLAAGIGLFLWQKILSQRLAKREMS